ncbi:hypothetical protein ACFXTH_017977 [Malus domestica]
MRNISEFKDATSWGTVGECPKKWMMTLATARGEVHWKKLEYGFIKVNTDTTWCKDTLRVSVGWISPDFTGLLQAVGGSSTGFCHTIVAAEACAIRDAMLACIDIRFDKVIIESNAKVII